MQATLLQVLHAPAHVHGPRSASPTEAEDGEFSLALTSASDLIDSGHEDATAAGRAPFDPGEASASADEAPSHSGTRDEPAAAAAQDPAAATSLPAWLADLKGRADRAGADRPGATAAARSDAASPGLHAADALSMTLGPGPQAAAGGAARGTALTARAALAPTDAASAGRRTPVQADATIQAAGMAPGQPADALDAGRAVPARSTVRTAALAHEQATDGPRPSAISTPSTAGEGAHNPKAGTARAEPDAASPRASLEGVSSGDDATAQRLTVTVEGEKVTIELRQSQPESAKAPAQHPETARALAGPGTVPEAAPRDRVADMEHRASDANAGRQALVAQAKGAGPRSKGQDEPSPPAGAQGALSTVGRASESAPASARSPETPPATVAQAPGPAPAAAALQALAAPPSVALSNAILPSAVLPVPRPRTGPGTLVTGAGEGLRALAAAADRARMAASAASGGAEAEAAQRVAGSDTSAASSAAQASSWMQALEAAVLQAGAESPHGVAPDATTSPGLAPVAGESGTRTDASAPESGTLPRIDAAPDSPQFPGMLGARVAAMVRDGVEQARIALNPQELGPVSVQIEMSGTQVRVDLAAEVEATRVALEQALPALAGSLREAGFTLAGGGVFQQARDGGSGDLSSGGSRQDGSTPAPGAGSTEPGPAPRASRPQGLVDLYA